MNEITELINNVGFPIAVSVALFYQLMKTNELVREFQSSIVQNTETIERLGDIIDRKENGNV
mgnify:CR=1 FL=1